MYHWETTSLAVGQTLYLKRPNAVHRVKAVDIAVICGKITVMHENGVISTERIHVLFYNFEKAHQKLPKAIRPPRQRKKNEKTPISPKGHD